MRPVGGSTVGGAPQRPKWLEQRSWKQDTEPTSKLVRGITLSALFNQVLAWWTRETFSVTQIPINMFHSGVWAVLWPMCHFCCNKFRSN